MNYRRLLLFLSVVILLVVLAASDPAHDAVKSLLEWLKPFIRNHDVLGSLIFMILSALSAVLIFYGDGLLFGMAQNLKITRQPKGKG